MKIEKSHFENWPLFPFLNHLYVRLVQRISYHVFCYSCLDFVRSFAQALTNTILSYDPEIGFLNTMLKFHP